MLGGQLVGEVHGLVHALADDDAAEALQRLLDNLLAGEVLHLAVHLSHGALRQFPAGGDEDGGGHAVVLGLAHQVGGQKRGVGALICHNEDFAGAGNHVNVHHAVQLLFGRGHKDVPRAHNLVHLGDAFGAQGQGGHCLGPAHQEHPVHPGHVGGGQDVRVRPAGAARRGGHDNLPHLRHLGGDDVHQHRGGIPSRAPGDVDAHPVQAPHPLAGDDAVGHGVDAALLLLALVEGADVLCRFPQGLDKGRVALRHGLLQSLPGELQVLRGPAVELLGKRLYGAVAPGAHLLDDVPHGLLNLRGGLAHPAFQILHKGLAGLPVPLYHFYHFPSPF